MAGEKTISEPPLLQDVYEPNKPEAEKLEVADFTPKCMMLWLQEK